MYINFRVFFGGKSIHAAEGEEISETALVSFFEQRELEFLDSDISSYSIATEEDLERRTYINEWKEELDISIDNVEIDYSVIDTIVNTTNQLKVLVYEWVWIDYRCNGYDELERMGFGTYHIISFEKNGEKLELLADTYTEITGYETGLEDDMLLLKKEMCTSASIEDEQLIVIEEETVSPQVSYSYNAGAAVTYSNTWCGNSSAGTSVSPNPANYNPSYYYYRKDCCNFVSQCLAAGGLPMEGNWTATLNTTSTVTEDTTYTKSGEAWRYVPTFKTYWSGKGHTVARITSSAQAVAGNPIFYLESDGYDGNHIMLIVGKNASGQVLVNGHNKDAYRYPLTLSNIKYYTLELTHSYTNVVSYNATTHTLSCSICGDTRVEAHTFASIAAVEATSRCVVCGFEK